jgi:hypothetical protein
MEELLKGHNTLSCEWSVNRIDSVAVEELVERPRVV